ncbi:transposase [Streptomyces sp. ISL-94]|nr:transposase [Streptomyces sp. ISL-94]
MPDPATGELISDAEVAEIPAYTAFTGRKKVEQVTARLIVRRVRDLAKPATVGEQGELFPVWRYHPFFTDNPAPTLQAEREHRHHAVVEQVIADSKASALAHLPSGHFHANAAWLTLWAMAYNLLRATGALTSAFHAKATTATLRAHLVHVPARIARSARRITLHLPTPPARARPETETVEKLGRPADTRCPPPAAAPEPAQNALRRPPSNHVGGSRLSRHQVTRPATAVRKRHRPGGSAGHGCDTAASSTRHRAASARGRSSRRPGTRPGRSGRHPRGSPRCPGPPPAGRPSPRAGRAASAGCGRSHRSTAGSDPRPSAAASAVAAHRRTLPLTLPASSSPAPGEAGNRDSRPPGGFRSRGAPRVGRSRLHSAVMARIRSRCRGETAKSIMLNISSNLFPCDVTAE